MQKDTGKRILRDLIVLSIPTMIEEVMSTLLQYVDTAMVGRLGEEATAAVSTTTTINWLVSSIPFALAIAVMAMISRENGAGNTARTRQITAQATWLLLLIGGLLTIICLALSPFIPVWMGAEPSVRGPASSYFAIISIPLVFRTSTIVLGAAIRATKNTRTPMLINLAANLLNAALNALFIYGLSMGVSGAAIASAIAYTLCGIAMFLVTRKTPALQFTKEDFLPRTRQRVSLDKCPSRSSDPAGSLRGPAPANARAEKDDPVPEASAGGCGLSAPSPGSRENRVSFYREFARIGLPALGTSLASCLGYVFFAGMVSGMGTTVFAAHSLAVTAEQLFYIPGYGLRTATTSLVGNALGENDPRKMHLTERFSIALTVAMMVVSGICLYLLAEPLMRLFTPSEPAALLGARMLRLVSFTEPFFGLMIVLEGISYGKGRTRGVFIVETFSMWAIRILFTFLTVKVWGLGLLEVWYCMIADNITKALLLLILYLASKKTLKQAKPA